MNLIKNCKRAKYSIILLILLFTSCMRDENNLTRLTKSNLKLVNNAIFEIVVPKNEDERVKYERALPWHQLNFKDRNDKFYSIGTAFFTSKKMLLSAAHVFSLEDYSTHQQFYVRNTQGEVFEVDKINRFSQYRDFIEFSLKTYPKEIQTLKLNEKVEIGDTVFAVGNAQGEGISVRGGQVASFTPEFINGKWDYIRFSSPASPGNSGGPLLNIRAEVVGIIVMKNQAENYNYAFPVSDFKNISFKYAEFFEENVTVYDGTQSEVKDWSVQYPLPAYSKDLSKKAHSSKNSFYGKLLEGLKKNSESKIFPRHEMFREYLLKQTLGKYFGFVESKSSKQEWDVKYTKMKKIKIGPRQFLHKGSSKLDNFEILIEKPKDISLNKFIDDHKMQMDYIISGMGFSRTMGKERVSILTFGAPDSSSSWKDLLGRKWNSSYWFITHENIFYSLDCLPVPKGVACLFKVREPMAISSGSEHFRYYNVVEEPLSYFGSFKQWKEFIELGDKYLPDNFFLKSISYNNGVKLKFLDNNISISSKEYNSKSSLLIHIGYNMNKPIGLSVESIKLQKEKTEREGIYLTRTFKPSELSSEEHIKRWSKIKKDRKPYDNKVFSNDNTFYSKKIIMREQNEAYVLTCFSEDEQHKRDLPKVCSGLSRNINKR